MRAPVIRSELASGFLGSLGPITLGFPEEDFSRWRVFFEHKHKTSAPVSPSRADSDVTDCVLVPVKAVSPSRADSDLLLRAFKGGNFSICGFEFHAILSGGRAAISSIHAAWKSWVAGSLMMQRFSTVSLLRRLALPSKT
jgi:hypothetical protein